MSASAGSAPPSLAVSTVIFALRPSEHRRPPHAVAPAGAPHPRTVRGPLGAARRPAAADESLQDAASRTCARPRGSPRATSSSSTPSATLRPLPRQRVVSIVYWALVQPDEAALARRARTCSWFARRRAAASSPSTTTRSSTTRSGGCATRWSTAASRTPSSARPSPSPSSARCYEAVLGKRARPRELPPPDRGHAGASSPPTSTCTGGQHRPPRLYRYNRPTAEPRPRQQRAPA